MNPNLSRSTAGAAGRRAIAGLFGTKFFGNVVGRKVRTRVTILGVLIAFVISFMTSDARVDGATL
jgi:NADH-quinone oxidoreductase subunit L